MNDFLVANPILNVKNLQASMDYYVQKLGFEKRWDWGDPPDFGCVSRGKIEIFLCQGGQGQPGMWMSIFMDDVDALYEEYKKSGATILDPPADCPWETREMLVEDLDGHRFRMSGKPIGQAGSAPQKAQKAQKSKPYLCLFVPFVANFAFVASVARLLHASTEMLT